MYEGGRAGLGKTHAAVLGWEEVDCTGSISIFLNEATMVLGPRSRVDRCPAMLAVVSQTVDVAAKVRGITTIAMLAMTLVTHLIVKNIWFHFHLHIGTCMFNRKMRIAYV